MIHKLKLYFNRCGLHQKLQNNILLIRNCNMKMKYDHKYSSPWAVFWNIFIFATDILGLQGLSESFVYWWYLYRKIVKNLNVYIIKPRYCRYSTQIRTSNLTLWGKLLNVWIVSSQMVLNFLLETISDVLI